MISPPVRRASSRPSPDLPQAVQPTTNVRMGDLSVEPGMQRVYAVGRRAASRRERSPLPVAAVKILVQVLNGFFVLFVLILDDVADGDDAQQAVILNDW